MAQRGRPTIIQSDDYKKFMADTYPTVSEKGLSRKYYEMQALTLISDAAAKIPYSELITGDMETTAIYNGGKRGIQEQLGRMLIQDGLHEEFVTDAAIVAAELLHEGEKSKDIERYLRKKRMSIKQKISVAATKNQIKGVNES